MNAKEMENQESIGKVLTKEELDALARTELNEDPNMVQRDVRALKQWIRKQPHLAKTAKQGE